MDDLLAALVSNAARWRGTVYGDAVVAFKHVCGLLAEAQSQLASALEVTEGGAPDLHALWAGAGKCQSSLRWSDEQLRKLGDALTNMATDLRVADERCDAADAKEQKAEEAIRRMQRHMAQADKLVTQTRVASRIQRVAWSARWAKHSCGPAPGPGLTLARCALRQPLPMHELLRDGAEAVAPALGAMYGALSQLASAEGGFVTRADGGGLNCAFPTPTAAARWAAAAQLHLLEPAAWPPQLVAAPGWAELYDSDTRLLLFRGPRLAIALAAAPGARVLEDPHGRTHYVGVEAELGDWLLGQTVGGEVALCPATFRALLAAGELASQKWSVAVKCPCPNYAGASDAKQQSYSAVPASLQVRLRAFAMSVAQDKLVAHDAEKRRQTQTFFAANPSPRPDGHAVPSARSQYSASPMESPEPSAHGGAGLDASDVVLQPGALSELRAAFEVSEQRSKQLLEQKAAAQRLQAELGEAQAELVAVQKELAQKEAEGHRHHRRRRTSAVGELETPPRSALPRRGTPPTCSIALHGDDGASLADSGWRRKRSVSLTDPRRGPVSGLAPPQQSPTIATTPVDCEAPASPMSVLSLVQAGDQLEMGETLGLSVLATTGDQAMRLPAATQTDSSCIELLRHLGESEEERWWRTRKEMRGELAVELRGELLGELRAEVRRAGGFSGMIPVEDKQQQTDPPAEPPAEEADPPARRRKSRAASVVGPCPGSPRRRRSSRFCVSPRAPVTPVLQEHDLARPPGRRRSVGSALLKRGTSFGSNCSARSRPRAASEARSSERVSAPAEAEPLAPGLPLAEHHDEPAAFEELFGSEVSTPGGLLQAAAGCDSPAFRSGLSAEPTPGEAPGPPLGQTVSMQVTVSAASLAAASAAAVAGCLIDLSVAVSRRRAPAGVAGAPAAGAAADGRRRSMHRGSRPPQLALKRAAAPAATCQFATTTSASGAEAAAEQGAGLDWHSALYLQRVAESAAAFAEGVLAECAELRLAALAAAAAALAGAAPRAQSVRRRTSQGVIELALTAASCKPPPPVVFSPLAESTEGCERLLSPERQQGHPASGSTTPLSTSQRNAVRAARLHTVAPLLMHDLFPPGPALRPPKHGSWAGSSSLSMRRSAKPKTAARAAHKGKDRLGVAAGHLVVHSGRGERESAETSADTSGFAEWVAMRRSRVRGRAA
eukprot:TRINITY_DN542_c0_g3_i1.p1 TRINITY_DN542_c0_g3~~TRINITY_DN542_c0_g3_i1.p1  ORF type:complete len:1177 (+),score=303.62 TRINITY_DN542_c0_g3_i1:83-3613(+)